ncbi:unnamed protein product [Periconia digitata]|uniref:Uncharacterized protein n=1 Tax=Periconia digitata TaxID=1303443 RepID=A0A9W4UR26_9PLEO|nr:unnamed protein product [Periconia digitata]
MFVQLALLRPASNNGYSGVISCYQTFQFPHRFRVTETRRNRIIRGWRDS